MDAVIETDRLTKKFGAFTAVDAISFEVRAGEIFGLLGPNGAGKTTLLRMITDILRPDAGSVLLEGHPVDGSTRRAIAYLPEERGLYRRSKVVEALAYFGELKGLSRRAARDTALQLLERVDLGPWANKQVMALSKGMQQKVQLCTALIGSPRLLILDEPFSGLDPINVRLFEDILAERRRAGATVLLSTHQMNKVEEVCDRALMMNRGHMVLHGAVRDIRRRYADHAIVVRAEGSLEGTPGVRSVAVANGEARLMLEPGATPDAVLRALLERGVVIEAFAPATPALEDIFVRVVRDGIGLDHGLSGPPPAPAAEPAA